MQKMKIIVTFINKGASIFPYRFLNPKDVQIRVGGWVSEKYPFRFWAEKKTVHPDFKEKWRKNCSVLFQMTSDDYFNRNWEIYWQPLPHYIVYYSK